MYTDDFFDALGAWQRGWSEEPSRRRDLAAALEEQLGQTPVQVRSVSGACYRKRFLYRGDFERLFLGGLDEGPTSWTVDRAFAQEFKGYHRAEAECAAVFETTPEPDAVLINIVTLWADPDFGTSLAAYHAKGGPNADALLNFKADQGEVVLRTKLQAIDVIGLTGVGSAIDDLFDQMGVIDAARTPLMRALVEAGVYPGEPTWVWDERALLVIDKVYDRIIGLLESLRARAKLPSKP
jgi:hypothetical protein